MVDWSVIMLSPGHTCTRLLFWSEWVSDLRSSKPQSRTLTNRQLCFFCLVVFCISSYRTMVDWSVIMLSPGHTCTRLLFWSEWESDLRSSTPQSRTLTNRQWCFLCLVVFCVSSSWYHGGLV